MRKGDGERKAASFGSIAFHVMLNVRRDADRLKAGSILPASFPTLIQDMLLCVLHRNKVNT